MDKFLNLVISGSVTGAIYSIMAAGLVLTYQTSGIFNFAHGAVAFVTAYLYYQLNTGHDIPIVPARDHLGAHLRTAARACPRHGPAAAARHGARLRAHRRARSASWSRCRRSRCGWSRRSATRSSSSTSRHHADDAGGNGPGIGPTPAPRASTSIGRRQPRLPISSRCSSRRGLAAVVLWLVIRQHACRARDARGGRPAALAGTARRQRRGGRRRSRGS